MEQLRSKKYFICDMDGVIYPGNRLLPGVKEFVQWMHDNGKDFLFLTNGSGKTPRELHTKLLRMGLDVGEDHFYTSAQATAHFLHSQLPGCSVYAIGEPGLIQALYNQGLSFNDVDPDYVVVGETFSYNWDNICKAMRLVNAGAKLIATNSDLTYPEEQGIAPACRALAAPIEITTGQSAYYVGKPNPLMMRTALHMLNAHSHETAMIGDNMTTDIIAGIESGMDTILVLSGVSTVENIAHFPYRPRLILNGVGDIVPGFADQNK